MKAPPVLCGLMGSCREGGAFWVLNVLRTAWQYIPAHPDKGGIREVRAAVRTVTPERIRIRMCVFLAALLCGQEDLEALSMRKYIVTQECEQAPIPAWQYIYAHIRALIRIVRIYQKMMNILDIILENI